MVYQVEKRSVIVQLMKLIITVVCSQTKACYKISYTNSMTVTAKTSDDAGCVFPLRSHKV